MIPAAVYPREGESLNDVKALLLNNHRPGAELHKV